MSRRQKSPLRTLTKNECLWLQRIARSMSEPASHVARAKQLLAVAAGCCYTSAAHMAGRKSNDAVAQLHQSPHAFPSRRSPVPTFSLILCGGSRPRNDGSDDYRLLSHSTI